MFYSFGLFGGLEIVEEPLMVEPKIVFPQDRFIEYEESDARWMLYIGEAKRVQSPMKHAYHVGDMLVMHPAMAAKMRDAIQRTRRMD